MGPLTSALINEATGSLRLAILAALFFYLPSLLVMAATDFDAARAEATLPSPRAASPRPLGMGGSHRSHLPAASDSLYRFPLGYEWATRGVHKCTSAGPADRLLPPAAPRSTLYGTSAVLGSG